MKTKLRGFIRHAAAFYHDFADTNMSVYSANASFFIILSAFPAIMLLLGLIQYTPITKDALLRGLEYVIPEVLEPLVSGIIEDLYTKASGALISITAISALWSASRGMLSILNGINAVYKLEENRGYFARRFIAVFYMLGFVISLVLTLLLNVFGNNIVDLLRKHLPELAGFGAFFINFRVIIIAVALTLCFMLIFKIFPNRKAAFARQLPGAAISAMGWLLFSTAFSIYVDNFGNYSYFYGSLAVIVIAMLWIYICIYILFIGAFCNSWLEKRHKKQAG